MLLKNGLAATEIDDASTISFVSSLDGQSTAPVMLNGLVNPVPAAIGSSRMVLRAGSTYTLSNELDITENGGDTVSTTGTTTALATVPGPSSLLLALAGLPVVGGLVWHRRRRSTVAVV